MYLSFGYPSALASGQGRCCPLSQVKEQRPQQAHPVTRKGQSWKQGPWLFLLPTGPTWVKGGDPEIPSILSRSPSARGSK